MISLNLGTVDGVLGKIWAVSWDLSKKNVICPSSGGYIRSVFLS